jgi:hypothetical protein
MWCYARGVDFRPADTSPEAWAAQAEALRRMGGAARTGIVFALNERARQMAMAGIRARHPGYDEEQVRFAWFRLKLGDELTRAVWPDRPLVDP